MENVDRTEPLLLSRSDVSVIYDGSKWEGLLLSYDEICRNGIIHFCDRITDVMFHQMCQRENKRISYNKSKTAIFRI